jgi:hypothetical protein
MSWLSWISAYLFDCLHPHMSVAAVTSTTSPQPTGLKAMDCAFSGKVHHA